MPSRETCDLPTLVVFCNAQNSVRNHQVLAKALIQKHKRDGETFSEEFFRCLKLILVQDDKLPVVERSVEFVATFCAAVNDDGQHETNELLQTIFNFLLEYHDTKSQAVRYRVCQMVDKIMNRLGQAELDVTICDKITECMMMRLLDKVAGIRAEAVKALYRLQDPEDKECPIVKAFLFHMGKDPSAEVRTNILRIIALSQDTVPQIIKRILDVRETVRCAAYKTLSRINLRSFSIGQRELLLSQGLRDRFDNVKTCVIKDLLGTWFTSMNKNFIELLTVLDVETSSETCTLVLDVLFEEQPLSEIMKTVPVEALTRLVPHDKQNTAVAFYWRSVASYLHAKFPEELDKVVPELSHYCSYIASHIKTKERSEWTENQKEFILKQLLEIVPVFDLSDEAGRCNLRQLLLDLLLNDEVQVPLVSVIISLLCEAIPDTSVRLQTLAEIVSEMHEPLTVVCSEMTAEEMRKKEIKKAELCVQLYEQQEIQENAIKRQDFLEAEALKPEIRELENKIAELTTQPAVLTQEVRNVKNDPFTLTKCLTVVSEMLQSQHITGLTPQLRSLLDNFVLSNLEVPDLSVLNARLQTLALYSVWDEDLAKKYMNLFMFYFNMDTQDNEEIYLTVIKAIFDLFTVHGLSAFQVDTEIAEVSVRMNKKASQKANTSVLDTTNILDTTAAAVSRGDFIIGHDSCRSLLFKLCNLLNSTTGEIRRIIAEGLCKLLLVGRVTSSRLVSHLLLLWFNPVTEQDPYVRQMLGCFLEQYSSLVPEAPDILEEAFLPVLTVILDAPEDSPLAEVDENDVVSLLINIMKSTGQVNVHNSLAMRLCNEILKHPENYYNKVYLKTLVNLSLSLDDVIRENLKNLADQIRKVVMEKSLQNYVKKFEQILEKGTDRDVNGKLGDPLNNDLLLLSGESDGNDSDDPQKMTGRTRSEMAATKNTKRSRNVKKTPPSATVKDARRALSLGSEDGDQHPEDLAAECNLPVLDEEMAAEIEKNEDRHIESYLSNVSDEVVNGNERRTTRKDKLSQREEDKTAESSTPEVNEKNDSGKREVASNKVKPVQKPAASVSRTQTGRGRKTSSSTRSVGMKSIPKKVRTRGTTSEETPQQKPPSPNVEESIAKSRTRRNVKASIPQILDDSIDELLATPDSARKKVTVSETSSDSEYTQSDDTDSDEVFNKKIPMSRKTSRLGKDIKKLQADFAELGK